MFHWPWNRIQVNQLVGLVKQLLWVLRMLKLTQLLADSLVKCIRVCVPVLIWLPNQSWSHMRSILEQKSYKCKATKAS